MQPLDFLHRFEAGSGDRVLLLLHGTGGDESDLLPLGRALDPNATLLSPRGKVSEGGMPRFFRRLAEGVFDEEDVVRRAGELSEFVRAAAAHYGFDLAQLIAIGYSNGANIAAAMLLLGVAPFHRAILLRAMVPIAPTELPALHGTGVLISDGARDPIVATSNAKRLESLLRGGGADVTLRFENAGHELARGDIAAATAWLGSAGAG
jgi:predicted esterase